jgi:biopolymer transport protein ExbB/TolQ
MACLALLSIISVGVIVDKFRKFQLASGQSQSFKKKFGEFLHGGDIQALMEASHKNQTSHVAQEVSAAINDYDGVRQKGGDPVACRTGKPAHSKTPRRRLCSV